MIIDVPPIPEDKIALDIPMICWFVDIRSMLSHKIDTICRQYEAERRSVTCLRIHKNKTNAFYSSYKIDKSNVIFVLKKGQLIWQNSRLTSKDIMNLFHIVRSGNLQLLLTNPDFNLIDNRNIKII